MWRIERIPTLMATRPIVTDPSQDITACDREPIHIPGAIQPHGLLLVVDAPTLTVIAGAGPIEDRLAAAWLGLPLDTLLGRDVAQMVADMPIRPEVAPLPPCRSMGFPNAFR